MVLYGSFFDMTYKSSDDDKMRVSAVPWYCRVDTEQVLPLDIVKLTSDSWCPLMVQPHHGSVATNRHFMDKFRFGDDCCMTKGDRTPAILL